MLTADEVLSVVRVHADRVHDAVRRLGCGPRAATRVVHVSALELVDAVARSPEQLDDPVGWWFARARALARQAATEDDALPLGSGVLSSDANQVRLAEALEARPERERAALLLRDSYDLPPRTVGTVLGVDAEAASEVVARARVGLLPVLTQLPPLPRSDHAQDLAGLARLAEGGVVAAREGATRRHAGACEACGALLDVQERARRLLSGLTVVALPDPARDALLAAVQDRAGALLPARTGVVEEDEQWAEEPHRGYSLSLMAFLLVLAVGIGGGIGALASRGSPTVALGQTSDLPLVTAPPAIRVQVSRTPTSTPSTSPTPRVFLVTPSPTPTPTASATPTATTTPSEVATSITINPTSGPRGTIINVIGKGWGPGSSVVIQFKETLSGQVGSSTSALVDDQGTFQATLQAQDDRPNALPQHTVSSDDGTRHAEATFTLTG